MWCVLEARVTSQSVVIPPSVTVTDLKKLELDAKVQTVKIAKINFIMFLQQHVLMAISDLGLET